MGRDMKNTKAKETRLLGIGEAELEAAAALLRAGGLVAFPTETVYGLGADALNAQAVASVYAAKGRPSDNPMIVHIARASDIGQLTPRLDARMIRLIENFWPGPLTLVVRKKEGVPGTITGGLDTVAVRMPDHPVALALIRLADTPVAAPSANLSGSPSPTRAEHVIQDLSGRIDAIVCGEDCRIGIESTVLDISGDRAVILRPGIITAENIEAAIDEPVEMDPALLRREAAAGGEGPERAAPRAPGMKYRHYAPKARMMILEGQRDRVQSELQRLKALNERLGNRVGILLFEEQAFIEAAHDFFAQLRELDGQGVDLILAGALSDRDGVGFAVMNRMLKAAGYNIVTVK